MHGVVGGPTEAARLKGRELNDLLDELGASLAAPGHAATGADASEQGASAEDTSLNLSAVLSRANVGILHRDLNGRVLLVNQRFCELVGRTPEELDGLPARAFIHPDDWERSDALFAAHVARAAPFEIEKRYVRADDAVIWCAVHMSFVKDRHGHAASTVTVAQDVTARREAECELRESEEHYRHTVELSPQIRWIAAPSGKVIEVSSRWAEVTGSHPREALDGRWLLSLHPDDADGAQQAWMAAVAAGTPIDIEYRLRTASGDYRWFRARATARRDAAGAVLRWYGTLEDIHDRKVAEDAVRESEERLRLAAQAANLGVWDYDAVAGRREWSTEFKQMLGLDPQVQPTVATALALVVPEDRHLLQALVAAVEAGDSGHTFAVTLRIHRADTGALRWMQTAGWRMQAPSGRLSRVLVTVRDITEERTAEERIRHAARHDVLTDLPNRGYFGEQLEAAIARAGASGTGLALVLFDVDHLKEINDSIGHDAGDVLLRSFASRLQGAWGPEAVIGRLGGDEFAAFVALPALGPAVPESVSAALHLLREPFSYEGYTLDCQATAGASIYPLHGESAADLLKSADLALYHGKAAQRGSVSTFRAEMRADLQRRSSMISIAREVVREGRVMPYYQPKVALDTGQIAGFEALLRWRHPHFGLQYPDTIAAAFDEFDLALALGERMLTLVTQDIRRWMDMGLDFGRVAVNLSPAEFRHDGLATRILDTLARGRVPASKLEVEVTETVFLGRGAETVAQMLETLHSHGVKIALDDFGTGYASLRHLKAFPVDVIKVDRSFVANLGTDSGDAAIVDAVVGLGQRLGMDVVAEGVETIEQARYLIERGCTFGQGYLFGHAMPAEEVDPLLRVGAANAGPWTPASRRRALTG